jgi:hypothetical protein
MRDLIEIAWSIQRDRNRLFLENKKLKSVIMDTNEIPWDVIEVVDGLLAICHHALPDSYWYSDARIEAARKLLGDSFPDDETLEKEFSETS